MNPDDVENPETDQTEPEDKEPDAAEISKRLAYLINLVDLTDDQEAELLDICQTTEYFDDLPDDIKIWFAKNEQEYGVAPGYEDVVANRTNQVVQRMEDESE